MDGERRLQGELYDGTLRLLQCYGCFDFGQTYHEVLHYTGKLWLVRARVTLTESEMPGGKGPCEDEVPKLRRITRSLDEGILCGLQSPETESNGSIRQNQPNPEWRRRGGQRYRSSRLYLLRLLPEEAQRRIGLPNTKKVNRKRKTPRIKE